MEGTASELERWREWHRHASATFRTAAAHVVNPAAATPAGHWSANDVTAHVRAEHDPHDNNSIHDVVELQMLTLDLAVHSWDLHRSQGSKATLENELCLALHAAFAPHVHLMSQDSAFAPPWTVTDDASPLAKLVALTGRNPEWSPRRR